MKKKRMKLKILNILFYIIVMIILYLSILINKDYSIINGRHIINSEDTLSRYKDYKFVTLDLSKSTETRFSISDNEKLKSNIYIVRYGDNDILVELSPSTVITNKIDLIFNEDNIDTNSLKEDLNGESKTKLNFISGYYTNVNLENNEDIVGIKLMITKIIIFVCFALACINFMFFVTDILIKRDYN